MKTASSVSWRTSSNHLYLRLWILPANWTGMKCFWSLSVAVCLNYLLLVKETCGFIPLIELMHTNCRLVYYLKKNKKAFLLD